MKSELWYIPLQKEESMDQVHKRFTVEQVKVLLKRYCQGSLDRPTIEEILGISRFRFIALLKQHRIDPHKFSLAYFFRAYTTMAYYPERSRPNLFDLDASCRYLIWLILLGLT